MARDPRRVSTAAGRGSRGAGEAGGDERSLPEFLPHVESDLAETVGREGTGEEETQLQVMSTQIVEASQDVGPREGGLLGALGPIDPVNLNFEDLPLALELPVTVGENQGRPIVRRVEVDRVEPVSERDVGRNRGPVMEGPPLVAPVGVPQAYGPQYTYPVPVGNPMIHGGRFDGSASQGREERGVRVSDQSRTTPARFGEEVRVGGTGVNPFWSPEVRNMAGRTGAVPSSSEHQQGFIVESREDPNGRVNPLELFRNRSGIVSAEPLEPVMDPVELFRLRCIREAEQKFAQGIARMTAPVGPRIPEGELAEGSSGSYYSAVPVGEKTPDVERPPGLDQVKVETPSGRGKGIGSVKNGKPELVNGAPNEPSKGSSNSGPVKFVGIEKEKTTPSTKSEPVGEVSSETLRSIDLPPLPQSANSLNFGDWLVIVEPIMGDISYSSGIWWNLVMDGVRRAYESWLKEDPLGRLRVQVEIDPKVSLWPRTEKRATNMLLQSLPEKLRVEIVSSRRLSTHQIMFRLFCLFQPGGQNERSQLLQLLTDFKLGSVVNEYAVSLRQWLRWLTRSEELELVLPDPMVLAGVLGRVSDTLAKSGTQVGFRLASTRQKLQLDCRPSLDEVKVFAEFLLAEAEEMSMSSTSSYGNPQTGGNKPAVKVLGVAENVSKPQREGPVPANAGNVTSKAACRFWLTDEGCRRGSRCKFVHSLLDPKDNRCFNCSGIGHGKRECPHLEKPKIAKNQVGKSGGKGENGNAKGSKGNDKSGKGAGHEKGGSSGGTTDCAKENPPNQKPVDSTGGEPSRDGGVNGELGSLLSEASALMKSLRPSIKMMSLKKANPVLIATGLLDGGATNALRRGTPKELANANEVTVELATGKATLFQDPLTGTLLTSENIEPIVPLRGVVDLGYRILWDASGCVINHPTQGKLTCWLRNGCPVVREGHAMKLIGEIEKHEMEKRLAPKLNAVGVSQEVVDWWKKEFPEVPPQVVELMKGQNDPKPQGSEIPWNRGCRKRLENAKAIVIHLYSAKSNYWKKGWPKGIEVLTLDIKENPKQDLNNPHVWSYVCWLVKNKPILAIIGGPPCRSVSRLRNVRPGPRPLRDRQTFRFGLEGLTEYERKLTNGDSALVLKQVALFKLAEKHRPSSTWDIGFLLESPEDPAAYAGEWEAPSFWTWNELRCLEEYGMRVVSFDQGMLGHEQNKPTSCLTNLPKVLELDQLRCSGNQGKPLNPSMEERFQQTASWAEWAEGLMAAIKESIVILGVEKGLGDSQLKRLLNREEWRQHILQGHRPFRRDCRACVLDMANGPQHRRRQHGGTSAWSLGVDVVQFKETRDDVTHVNVKYAVVATALVPRFEEIETQKDYGDALHEDVEKSDWGEGLAEEEFEIEPQKDPLKFQGKGPGCVGRTSKGKPGRQWGIRGGKIG